MLKDLYNRLGKPRLCNPFKRTVTVVYQSMWLHGTYAFTFKAGSLDIKQRWMDHLISMLPDDMPSAALMQVRQNPSITIVQVF